MSSYSNNNAAPFSPLSAAQYQELHHQVQHHLSDFVKNDESLKKVKEDLQENIKKLGDQLQKTSIKDHKAHAVSALSPANILLTKQFYSIFYKSQQIPEEEIAVTFNKYLSDNSLSLEKSAAGKTLATINSISSIIQYLKDHPSIELCNFKSFKTFISDDEIKIFATYLKLSDSKALKAIAFNETKISAESKKELNQAVEKKNNSFKVHYLKEA